MIHRLIGSTSIIDVNIGKGNAHLMSIMDTILGKVRIKRGIWDLLCRPDTEVEAMHAAAIIGHGVVVEKLV
jgi:hypothetical protein